MSVLAWLFGLGALAAAFPFLFHLIRRTPAGQTQFSSLMFLKPSPPSLTRRSRLDNLLLLAMRMAAIALIAAAFMRPFLRGNTSLDFADLPGRKIAVLVDTSASMQRGDLWQQAVQRTETIVAEADAKDDVAIYTFDSKLENRKPFGLTAGEGELSKEVPLDDVKPGWLSSNLGAALSNLADELDQESDGDNGNAKLQIIVVTDLQAGSSTTALQNYQWPSSVMVDFEQVVLDDPSNATLELLPVDAADPDVLRENVLVRNSNSSGVEQFNVAWDGTAEHAVGFYVAPGSSRILRVPRQSEATNSERLVLTGDPAEFDNVFYSVPTNQLQTRVAYLGDESNEDPGEMLYYLERGLLETPARAVTISQHTSQQPFSMVPISTEPFSTEPDLVPPLVIVARPLVDSEQAQVASYLENGGNVFVALGGSATVESTQQFTGITGDMDAEDVDAAGDSAAQESDDYAMLVEISFDHPLFEIFAGPRFNDFTQIRFWNHVKTTLPETDEISVIARFDDDSPAMWHRKLESSGEVIVLAAGWQPDQSQLALSGKFLPLMNRLVDLSVDLPEVADSVVMGQPLSIPAGYLNVESASAAFKLDPEQPVFEQIDSPDVYRFSNPTDASAPEIRVAVNVDPSESDTETMAIEQISAFEVNVGRQADSLEEIQRQRQMQDRELEDRQKLWKWLIIGALGLLIAETFLAGRTDRTTLQGSGIPRPDVDGGATDDSFETKDAV